MATVAVFNGTIRQGAKTPEVTRFVVDEVNAREQLEAELIDMARFDLTFDNEGKSASPEELRQIVTEAEGYIIVAPEYNHGYPGSLKYLLDMNLREYVHKPVALVGVSAGPFGGTRVIEQLVGVVRELGMVVTFADMNVSGVGKEFVDGKPVDEEKWQRRVGRVLTELEWMMETLKYGREHVASEYH